MDRGTFMREKKTRKNKKIQGIGIEEIGFFFLYTWEKFEEIIGDEVEKLNWRHIW